MSIRGRHCLAVLEPKELDQIGRLLPVPRCLADVPAIGVGQVRMQLFEVEGTEASSSTPLQWRHSSMPSARQALFRSIFSVPPTSAYSFLACAMTFVIAK